jgi:hypothetical protein
MGELKGKRVARGREGEFELREAEISSEFDGVFFGLNGNDSGQRQPITTQPKRKGQKCKQRRPWLNNGFLYLSTNQTHGKSTYQSAMGWKRYDSTAIHL